MYSKAIQNKLEINIINYKFFSGKYRVGEKNGKNYIFFGVNDEIIFEGEYVNGKRNGKGKEYGNYGKIKFEGEYLNGNRLIGIEYEKDGKNFKKINKRRKKK